MNSMKLVVSYILFHEKRPQTMLWHHNARVNSQQRWKQTRFHLWCELTNTMNVTEWQVSWNSSEVLRSVHTYLWRITWLYHQVMFSGGKLYFLSQHSKYCALYCTLYPCITTPGNTCTSERFFRGWKDEPYISIRYGGSFSSKTAVQMSEKLCMGRVHALFWYLSYMRSRYFVQFNYLIY